MPRPFPASNLTIENFYSEALMSVATGERVEEGAVPDEKEKCICDKHGEFEPIYLPKYDKPIDGLKGLPCKEHTIINACKQCASEKQKELYDTYKSEVDKKAEEKKERDMLAKIESYGVTLRNIHHDIRNITPRNDTQAQAIEKAKMICKAVVEKQSAGNLILSGSVGTGKTLIAGSAVAALIRDGRYAKIRTVSSIIRHLKGSWRRDCEYTEQDVIDDMIKLDLLVIDEIGVQFGSDTEKMFIFEIIDGRYNKMKPTILISNLAVDGIKELIGERCIDRLREDGGKVIAFDYESQRGKK